MDFPSSSCLCGAVARLGLLLTSWPFTPFPAPNLRGASPAKQPACLLSSAAGYFAPPRDSPSSQTKYLLQSPILRCSGASAAPCQLRQGSAPASPWSASVLPGLWLLGSRRASAGRFLVAPGGHLPPSGHHPPAAAPAMPHGHRGCSAHPEPPRLQGAPHTPRAAGARGPVIGRGPPGRRRPS